MMAYLIALVWIIAGLVNLSSKGCLTYFLIGALFCVAGEISSLTSTIKELFAEKTSSNTKSN